MNDLFLTIHKHSTREQGYTVSDCVGEGLKAAMGLQFELELVVSNAVVFVLTVD